MVHCVCGQETHRMVRRSSWLLQATVAKTLLVLLAFLVAGSGALGEGYAARSDVRPATSGGGTLDERFCAFFTTWLRERWGPVLYDAVYDPHIFSAFRNGSFEFPDFAPIVGIQATVPPIPAPLSSTERRIWYVKHHASVVLGTICHDPSMAALYRQFGFVGPSRPAAAGATRAVAASLIFRSRLAHLVDGHLRYTMLLMSTIMESVAEDDAEKALWQRMEAARDELFAFGGHAPALVLLRRIVLGTTPEDVRRWMDSELATGGSAAETEALTTSPVSVLEATNTYEVASRRFQAQMPLHEKYLYAFRAMIICNSLVRECEEPDGCRYLCNLPYLQHAPREFSLGEVLGEHGGAKPQTAAPFFHRFIGIGSRNEYHWELSMLRLFPNPSASPSPSAAFAVPRNGLYTVSTFDCTVAWQPPSELTRPGTGWSRTSLCVSASTPKSIPMSRVLPLIEDSEQHDDGVERDLTLRYPIHPAAKRLPPPPRRRSSPPSKPSEPTSSLWSTPLRAFDDVTILKVDIEGHEYQFVHEWYREYVTAFSRASPSSGQASTTSSDLLSVSQFLFEVHGGAASVPSVWRIHAMLMQMQRMGYLQVMMEINLWSSTAAEVAMVHFHYFMKSELWMALSRTMTKGVLEV